jgi:hypothetical protein
MLAPAGREGQATNLLLDQQTQATVSIYSIYFWGDTAQLGFQQQQGQTARGYSLRERCSSNMRVRGVLKQVRVKFMTGSKAGVVDRPSSF